MPINFKGHWPVPSLNARRHQSLVSTDEEKVVWLNKLNV